MAFDAHKAFAFFGGVCRRGVYDTIETAVETILVGEESVSKPARRLSEAETCIAKRSFGFRMTVGFSRSEDHVARQRRFAFEELGLQAVKNIAEPISAHRIGSLGAALA